MFPRARKFVAAALLLMLGAASTFASELVDIRTGFHRTYSRVVLQFDSRVRFRIIPDETTSSLLLEVQPVAPLAVLREVPIEEIDPYLHKVTYAQTSRSLKATILLKRRHLRYDAYTLNWPFRVVVDIYPSRQREAPPDNLAVARTIATEPAENAMPDSSLLVSPADRDTSSATTSAASDTLRHLYGVDLADKVDLTRFMVPGEDAGPGTPTRPREAAADQRKLLFLTLVAVFVLVDVVLLVSFVVKRSGRTRLAAVSTQPGTSPKPAALSGREFIDALRQTLADAEERKDRAPVTSNAAELASVASAIKIDQMIASLSKAVRSKKPEFTLPALEDVVRELGESPDGLSKELLIGRDGQAFLENIRRLNVN
ncbi:MAG: hypothetical protein D6743_03285 [Calditrichaeota bacterium]|nr:MAG: hypothetical protein D6743_03285 [Calditrichota bacterium]